MAEIKNIKIVTVWQEGKLVKENIDFLRTPTKKVNFPISPQVKKIIKDLETSFRSIPCAGIAANQLGYDKKIFHCPRAYQNFDKGLLTRKQKNVTRYEKTELPSINKKQ